jgi:aryl-alcohol dehydrogenase-like predicted oxidoreductase
VFTDETFELLEGLAAFADERGVTMLDLAFGWLLSHATVASVIAGASTPEQVRANAGAGSRQPSEEDLSALRDLLRPAGASD